MNATSLSKAKPPRDFFPMLYWLLFILVVPIVAFWMGHKPVPQVILPILHGDVPVYHVITKSDIFMQSFDKSTMTTDTISKENDLIGHYTLVTIRAGKPIHEDQIAPQPPMPPPPVSLMTNTLAVAIPANSAMIFGGNLHAGDIVSLAAVPTSNNNAMSTMIFEKVLVLDVKSAGNQSVIVLAIPAQHWLDYLAKIRNSTIVIALQVG